MQIHQNAAALYVGGGLTQDSDPAKEWLETERKSEALGRFLG
jgi:isochorismate synthase